MLPFLNGILSIEQSLFIGVVASFVLGALLLLIKVPITERTRKIAISKKSIVICYFLCSCFMLLALSFSGVQNYERLVSMILFIITAASSVILSVAMINILEEGFIDRDKYYLNLALDYSVSFFLVRSFWWKNASYTAMMLTICAILFLIQCVLHIHYFIKVYKKCLAELALEYDEDEDKRMRRVKFCYVMMMCTQMFILVYFALPRAYMMLWIFWYSLFILYFTANFLSYVGSHKLVLDAFAYKTLSGQELKNKFESIQNKVRGNKAEKKEKGSGANMPGYTINDTIRLERAIERWIAAKKYCEFDKTREEIAADLRTTKEFLQLYFATKIGMDFRTWRTKLRIDEAKHLLLQNKEASIQIIAEAAGFSDKSNFHRQFVKFVGCSPKEWRDSGGKPSVG